MPQANEVKAINFAKLRQLQKATKQTKHQLIPFLEIFFDETPKIFDQAKTFSENGENAKTHLKIHYIKGSADAIGADHLSKKCESLIDLIQDCDSDSMDLSKKLADIESSIKETTLQLKAWLDTDES
jgi:HPt (histidine-containing phosphotransfer) domain-containing protein